MKRQVGSNLAVCALIALSVSSLNCRRSEILAGRWRLVTHPNWSELRDGQRSLLVRTIRGDVLLAEAVEAHRVIPPDCIVFSSYDDGEYYFTCDDRQPIRIRTEPLLGRSTPALEDGNLYLVDEAPGSRVRLEINIQLVRRLAISGPQIREGWQSDRELKEFVPVIVRR